MAHGRLHSIRLQNTWHMPSLLLLLSPPLHCILCIMQLWSDYYLASWTIRANFEKQNPGNCTSDKKKENNQNEKLYFSAWRTIDCRASHLDLFFVVTHSRSHCLFAFSLSIFRHFTLSLSCLANRSISTSSSLSSTTAIPIESDIAAKLTWFLLFVLVAVVPSSFCCVRVFGTGSE